MKHQNIFPTVVTVERWYALGLISNAEYNWYMNIFENEIY